MQVLEQLVTLSMASCYGANDMLLEQLLPAFPNLVNADFRGCYGITDAGVNVMTNHCRALERVDLSCSSVTARSWAMLLTRCLHLIELIFMECPEILSRDIVDMDVVSTCNLQKLVWCGSGDLSPVSIRKLIEEGIIKAERLKYWCDNKICDNSLRRTLLVADVIDIEKVGMMSKAQCAEVLKGLRQLLRDEEMPFNRWERLRGYDYASVDCLQKIAELFPGLRRLNISGRCTLTMNSFEGILTRCEHLKSLTLWCWFQPMLRDLTCDPLRWLCRCLCCPDLDPEQLAREQDEEYAVRPGCITDLGIRFLREIAPDVELFL